MYFTFFNFREILMKYEFYIDESGNTGDIFCNDFYKNLSDQPYYVSVAIGIDLQRKEKLEADLKEIFSKYTKTGKEIKCKDFYKKRPAIIVEAIDFIIKNNIPFFVDTVDKKYCINTTMCNHYLFNPCSLEEFNKEHYQRVADFLTKHMDKNYYLAFNNFLLEPNDSNLIELFQFFKDAMERNIKGLLDKSYLIEQLEKNKNLYLSLKDKYDEKSLGWFTPIPDYTKNGNKIILLPNLSTLAHLVARVNYFYNLENVVFIHDTQNDFDDIYSQLITSLADKSKLDLVETPYANFHTDKVLDVSYCNSKDSVFIQLADVLSGFISRYYKSLFLNSQEIEKIYDDIFCKIWSKSLARTGFGIHMTLGISSRKLIENRFNTCKNK